jgi:tetratricopeptide (TPR) repeat protein
VVPPGEPTRAATSETEPEVPGRSTSLEPGTVVGRLVVLQTIGSGGMGVVYAAYDPELDRNVALKLLVPGHGSDTQRRRLLREAQALARLSHPNVVAIHDVGPLGDGVWLAMELVQGQTLHRWLTTPRSQREVLATLCAAGEGLAAAHSVGLLHRDFKPDNVMVGDDGRVRVMDFGLARLFAGASAEEPEPSNPGQRAHGGLVDEVTRAGVLVGTPSYMAPEQFANVTLTAAADQFAFCVTLWQALYGERPFEGRSAVEIAASVLGGKLRPPPRGHRVPTWLRRACERGLCTNPAQRWPSMRALLDTLANGRARVRVRRGVMAAAVVVVLGAGVEAERRWSVARRAAACETTGDEISSAWNDARAEALREALLATNASYAPTTTERVLPWLDHQARGWREQRVEACLDAEVRERWSAEALDRSLWCLEERRLQLESLVDELLHADASALPHAVPAAAGLPAVAPCRDDQTLAVLVAPPLGDREAIRAARASMVRASSLGGTGRNDEGTMVARAALQQAEALEWMPLVAAARLELGRQLVQGGAHAEAERVFEQAFFEADNGVAPGVAFDAANALVHNVGIDLARHPEGQRWARHAEAALEGVPDGEHLREAALLDNTATVHEAMHAHDEARRLYEQALALREAALGSDHPQVAASLNDLANVHRATGDLAGAKRLYERAIEIWQQALGPDHPRVATSLNNLAIVLPGLGERAQARLLSERALAIREAALGPNHPQVASSLNNVATLFQDDGAYEEAKRLQQRALAIWQAAYGPDHPRVAAALNNLAIVHQLLGEHDQAKALFSRSLAIAEKTLGPEHPDVALSLVNLARAEQESGDYERAKALYERALTIQQQVNGPEHPQVPYLLVGLAEVALAQQRPGEALALAQRAVTVRERGNAPAGLLASARFTLARASWEAPPAVGGDPVRARALAEQARDGFAADGQASARDVASVQAWLAAHPSP